MGVLTPAFASAAERGLAICGERTLDERRGARTRGPEEDRGSELMVCGECRSGHIAASNLEGRDRRMTQEIANSGPAHLTRRLRMRNTRAFGRRTEVRFVGIERGFLLDVRKGQRTSQQQLNGDSTPCNELATVHQTELL